MISDIHNEFSARIGDLVDRVARVRSTRSQDGPARRRNLASIISELSTLVTEFENEEKNGVAIQSVGVTTVIHEVRVPQLAQWETYDRLEEDLRSSNERLRATFEHAAVGFAHVMPGGRYLRVNDKLCKMTGYTRDEMMSMSFMDIIQIDVNERGASEIGNVLSGKVEHCNLENRLIRKNGEIVWVSVTASAIRDSDETVQYISCVMQDITERKLTAYQLTKSLRILSTAEQIAGTGGWEFDVQSGTISRSDELCRMIGVPCGTEARPFDRVLDLVHPDDRTAMSASLNHAIETGTPYACKYRLLTPDGRNIIISVRGEPITDEFGRVIRVIGSTQDVTTAEEAALLLDQRCRMSRLSGDVCAALTPNELLSVSLKQCTDALIEHLDAYLAIVWAHNAENNMLELKASSMNLTCDSAITDISQFAELNLVRFATGQKPYITNSPFDDLGLMDAAWIRSESIASYAALPLIINKKLVGVLALFSRHRLADIDVEALKSTADAIAVGIQRRNLEDGLQTINTNLEQLIGERTKQLQAAHKELDQFTYSVAHELRAPLRHIDDLSQAIVPEFELMPEQARTYLQRVRKSAGRMQNLIDDLLSLSNLGSQPMNMQSVDMNVLVEEVISELRLLNHDRSIEIHIGDLPACNCDPWLMRQVFTNLLANSFKYTGREKHPKIDVGCRKESDKNVFFVRDNGVGFDMRYAKRLFDAFQRMHSSVEFDGSGIGLAIVHRIVSRHGGQVWAEARPGEGAVFYVALKGAMP